jgi:hypothetical protein
MTAVEPTPEGSRETSSISVSGENRITVHFSKDDPQTGSCASARLGVAWITQGHGIRGPLVILAYQEGQILVKSPEGRTDHHQARDRLAGELLLSLSSGAGAGNRVPIALALFGSAAAKGGEEWQGDNDVSRHVYPGCDHIGHDVMVRREVRRGDITCCPKWAAVLREAVRNGGRAAEHA